MDITTKDSLDASVIYAHYRTINDRAVYIGPAHSDLVKDQLLVQSVSPKRAGTSYGNRRSSVNLINTEQVLDAEGLTVAKDMKAEFSVSIPAGTTLAAFKERVARMAGVLADPTLVEDLFFTGKID